MTVEPSWYLLLGAALFAIGAFGVLGRRHVLHTILCLQVMLLGVNLTAVVVSLELDARSGWLLVAMLSWIAVTQGALGWALSRALFERRKTMDLDHIDLMRF